MLQECKVSRSFSIPATLPLMLCQCLNYTRQCLIGLCPFPQIIFNKTWSYDSARSVSPNRITNYPKHVVFISVECRQAPSYRDKTSQNRHLMTMNTKEQDSTHGGIMLPNTTIKHHLTSVDSSQSILETIT